MTHTPLRTGHYGKGLIVGLTHAGGVCSILAAGALLLVDISLTMVSVAVGVLGIAGLLGSILAQNVVRRWGASNALVPSVVAAGVVNTSLVIAQTVLPRLAPLVWAILVVAVFTHLYLLRLLRNLIQLQWLPAESLNFEANMHLAAILGSYVGAAAVAMVSHGLSATQLLFGQGAASAVTMVVLAGAGSMVALRQPRLNLSSDGECRREMRSEGAYLVFTVNAAVKALLLALMLVFLAPSLRSIGAEGSAKLLGMASLSLAGCLSLAVLLYMVLTHGPHETWNYPLMISILPLGAASTLIAAAAAGPPLGMGLFVLVVIAATIALYGPVLSLLSSVLNPKLRDVRAAVSLGYGAGLGVVLAGGITLIWRPVDRVWEFALIGGGTMVITLSDLWLKHWMERFLNRKMISGAYAERFLAIATAPIFRGAAAIAGLRRVLDDPNDVIRTNAILSLGEIRRHDVAEILTAHVDSSNLFVRSAAIKALERTRNKAALKRVLQRMIGEQRMVYKTQVLSMFKGFQKAEIIPLVEQLTSHPNARMRANALEVLDTIHDKNDPAPFLKCFDDDVPRVRVAAIIGARARGDAAVRERCSGLMLQLSQSAELRERTAGLWGLGKFGAVAELLKALKDPEIEVRRVAVRALTDHVDPSVVFPLLEQLSVDDEEFNQLTLNALVQFGERITMSDLEPFLDISSPVLLRNIGHLLLRVNIAGCENVVRRLLLSGEPRMQLIGLKTAVRHELPRLSAEVMQLTNSSSPEVVSASLNALARLGERGEINNLDVLLKNPEPHIRSNALLALGRTGGKGCAAEIAAFANDPDHRVRAIAGMILVGMDDPRGVSGLERMLQSGRKWEIVSALYVLGELKRTEFFPRVLDFQHHSDPDVQRHVTIARQKIEAGLGKDMKKLRRYLNKIETQLQPNLQYLISYLNESPAEGKNRFAADLLSEITSGRIRRLLPESLPTNARQGEALTLLMEETRLRTLEVGDLVELLATLSGSESVENQSKILAALQRKGPLSEAQRAVVSAYAESTLAAMRSDLTQLFDLVSIDQERIVRPLIRALRQRFDAKVGVVLQLVSLLYGVSTKLLQRQLESESDEGKRRVCETLAGLQLSEPLVGIHALLEDYLVVLPRHQAQPKQQLDINMILGLLNSEDASLQSAMLSGVGDLVTTQFLRVLSDTLAVNNPTLQLISLQTLEQIKAILEK